MAAAVLGRAGAVQADREDDRSNYAGAHRGIDWRAAAASLGLQALFLVALLSLGLAAHKEKHERLTVLSIQERQDQPAAPSKPAPAQREVKPTVQPQPKTEVIAPQPKVDVQPRPQQIAAAAEAPSDPSPPAAPAPNPAPAAPAGASGPVKVANLNSNLLSAGAPSYPMGSRRKREEGTVVLRVVVSPEGRVAEVTVHQSSGFPALDEAALAAVRKWRWTPTMRDGHAVAITGLVRLPFTLRES